MCAFNFEMLAVLVHCLGHWSRIILRFCACAGLSSTNFRKHLRKTVVFRKCCITFRWYCIVPVSTILEEGTDKRATFTWITGLAAKCWVRPSPTVPKGVTIVAGNTKEIETPSNETIQEVRSWLTEHKTEPQQKHTR
ncbi:uncharacterized protein LOC119658206 [Hermetia illucens]|uniref:uncharacterized protein LOC119658206 n=1 Tax=Hermetia illucens TaxID=343691 RepID=UPI0018CC5F42|nr:uncharacterized protein LOC119658206 [Hermetia illucens]